MCTTQGYLIKIDYNKMEPRSQNFPTIIWGSGEAAPVLLSANALKGSGLYPTRVGRAFGESGAEKCFDCGFPDAWARMGSPGPKNDPPCVETSDEEHEHRPNTRQPPNPDPGHSTSGVVMQHRRFARYTANPANYGKGRFRIPPTLIRPTLS